MKYAKKIKGFFRQTWPWLSVLAGVLGGLLLAPAEPAASWWPTAEWACHALTGLGVGIGVLIIGGVLGLATGTISVPGFTMNEKQDADDLDEIRKQIANVVEKQQELNQTATEALALSRETMRAILGSQLKAPSAKEGKGAIRRGSNHD